MPKKYFVVGGEYADTSFTTIAAGHKEDRFGPFDEKDAHVCWRALTGKTVDNAMVRYFIRTEGDENADHWYVVGGEYADTDFEVIAPGKSLETHGPYSRAEAMAKWRELTGKTVDNAMIRYDLATGAELAGRQG
ncbi:MAG: DUF4170 domain-containing protein [Alphaproteobacteria bacterium]|nr:DUF4170 domain-containing protein [Alphaproteobacteria bacterium]